MVSPRSPPPPSQNLPQSSLGLCPGKAGRCHGRLHARTYFHRTSRARCPGIPHILCGLVVSMVNEHTAMGWGRRFQTQNHSRFGLIENSHLLPRSMRNGGSRSCQDLSARPSDAVVSPQPTPTPISLILLRHPAFQSQIWWSVEHTWAI